MATEPQCLAGPSVAGPSTAASNKSARRYQHFIPQFLLKNFSHKYVAPDYPDAARGRRRDPRTGIYSGEPVVNCLRLSGEFSLEECPARRACGLENMYEDTENLLKDYGHLENKFAAMESTASLIYRKIIKAYKDGKDDIWLTRAEKDVLRKFMFLLTLSSVQYHRKFNLDSIQEYEGEDKGWLKEYMEGCNIIKPIDIWLQSLEAIIDLEIDTEGKWEKFIKEAIYFPIGDMFVDYINEMYMTICTPDNHVEEFILTDNCCNVIEGRTPAYPDTNAVSHLDLAPCFHKFAPISPKLMIVLRSTLLPEPLDSANSVVTMWRQVQQQIWIDTRFGNGTKSLLEDLPIRKAKTTYMEEVNGELKPRTGQNHKPGQHDNFCFTIFKIPSRHVRIINGLLIDHAFHGSRIIFLKKKAFLDLVEWFLAEPCVVGKKLTEKYGTQQLAYIKGLSQFMEREGREGTCKWTIASSGGHDLEQTNVQNVAAAKFLEDPNRAKDGTGLDCETIYRTLGGTTDSFQEDMAAAAIMLETWTMSVDLNYGSPEYEATCRRKLERLLEGYQRHPTTRFWLFLKKMRLAQTVATRALQSVQNVTLFVKEECQGSEDLLAYAHSIIPDNEINVAMYKAFNESIAVVRGAGCGLESMGHFSLFGDAKWRIPNPASGQDEPFKVGKAKVNGKKGRKGKKTVCPAAPDVAIGKVSTESPGQNQQLDVKEKIDAQKAICSSQSGANKRKTSTGAMKPCDDDKTKEEAGIKKEVCTAVNKIRKPDCPLSNGNQKNRSTRPNEQQPAPNHGVKMEVGPVTRPPSYLSQFLAWGRKTPAEAIARNKKAYDALLHDRKMMYAGMTNAFLLVGSLGLYIIGAVAYVLSKAFYALGYFLSHLVGGLVWLLNHLAVLLSILPFSCFFMAKYLLFAAVILAVICLGILKIRRIL